MRHLKKTTKVVVKYSVPKQKKSSVHWTLQVKHFGRGFRDLMIGVGILVYTVGPFILLLATYLI